MKRSLLVLAAVVLSATPAYACPMSARDTALILALALPVMTLLVGPIVLLGHDLLRMPFGFRPSARGALVRAVLGAGGACLGFWGAAFNQGSEQLGLVAYGAACAVLLSYSAAAVLQRRSAVLPA